MKKIKVPDCICQLKMIDHDKIKDRVLSEISKSFDELIPKSNDDSYYVDSISRLDWNQALDLERPWVKIVLPNFRISITEFLTECGYNDITLNQMWYQQYEEGDQHGWHIHGCHYTGVYYLEYPKGSAKTEVCSPYNLKSQKIEDVEEGDIIIFPAHWIHRGLENGKDRKTIVSYNLDIDADRLLNTELVNSVNTGKPYIFF